MAKKYYQTFVVETNFNFPIDMLRYDCCFPDTEKDSGLIDRSLTSPGMNRIKVKISRFVNTKNQVPSIERWFSFGCQISEVEVR